MLRFLWKIIKSIPSDLVSTLMFLIKGMWKRGKFFIITSIIFSTVVYTLLVSGFIFVSTPLVAVSHVLGFVPGMEGDDQENRKLVNDNRFTCNEQSPEDVQRAKALMDSVNMSGEETDFYIEWGYVLYNLSASDLYNILPWNKFVETYKRLQQVHPDDSMQQIISRIHPALYDRYTYLSASVMFGLSQENKIAINSDDTNTLVTIIYSECKIAGK